MQVVLASQLHIQEISTLLANSANTRKRLSLIVFVLVAMPWLAGE